MSVPSTSLPTLRLVLLFAAGLVAASQGNAQQSFSSFAAFDTAVRAAMRSESLTQLEFTASGWEACLGQPWRIDAGWARWELTAYHRVIDYAGRQSLHTAQRRAGMDPDKLGGCGAQPDAAAQAQQGSITTASPWANQLPLWLTPQGFLVLAANNTAAVAADDSGWIVSFSTTQGTVTYPFSGHFNGDLLLERIETRLDNTVYGDMLVEAEFSDWRDFSGLQFPAHLVQKQGGLAVLDLIVSEVIPNSTASAAPPERPAGGPGGGGAAPQQATEAVTQVAPGIWVSNGAYQGVFVEFDDYSLVIDGLQSDARAAELIAQVKATIPGKPIKYVISTHNHFDHASGLRAFAAEGATIITHNSNVEFFKTALSAPRTLTGGAPQPPITVSVMGIDDFEAVFDGRHLVQIYHLQGSLHADDMLIAYLPVIQAVVEADVLQPWLSPAFGGNFEGGHPFLVHLANELDRIGIDYTQFIPVHRPPQPPFQSKAELMTAIGRE